MSAGTVAARVTADPPTQAAIVRLLERFEITDGECERVLRIVDVYTEACAREGVEVTHELVIRAGAFGVDLVLSARKRGAE